MTKVLTISPMIGRENDAPLGRRKSGQRQACGNGATSDLSTIVALRFDRATRARP
jgi:hypothetical protein